MIDEPRFPEYIRRFLFDMLYPLSPVPGSDTPLINCPALSGGKIRIFHSATSVYYAPSDICGIGGMHRETVRACPSWFKGPQRYDTVFITKDQTVNGFRGLHVARVRLFFDFTHSNILFPCALVEWFVPQDTRPCDLTRMWVVEPEMLRGKRVTSIVHLDTILRGAHLIGKHGNVLVPRRFQFYHSLSSFHSYYVNKYIDHHSHEIAF
jgi:hypothetical protein